MDLSYQEKQDRLNIRIRAHKKFANIDISDWIDDFMRQKARMNVFDIGCGNGNHLEVYMKHVARGGALYGMDREASLIKEAKSHYKKAANLFLSVGSMDDPLPYEDEKFDTCFSNFAIYNAANLRNTLLELKRVMKPQAELVMIGPTKSNAKELYEFNKRLTGKAIDEITLIRTDRLRQEVLPITKEVFNTTEEHIINSYLTFPNKGEFIKYYRSTMLYEEGAEKLGLSAGEIEQACLKDKDIMLSKEMLAIIATKS